MFAVVEEEKLCTLKIVTSANRISCLLVSQAHRDKAQIQVPEEAKTAQENDSSLYRHKGGANDVPNGPDFI
jgi:hypothetical protein